MERIERGSILEHPEHGSGGPAAREHRVIKVSESKYLGVRS